MEAQSITVFRNRIRPEAWEEYGPLSDRMAELADTMPGFVERKTFTAEDGERVTLVTFETHEHRKAWGAHPEHRAAQRTGIDRLYSEYRLQLCTLDDERAFSLPE